MKEIHRLFLVIFFTALFAGITHSQQMEDVIYLKNGSIIRGIIIEQTPNVSIKIKTKDGSIFAYKYEEIDKFAKEEVKGSLYGEYDNKTIGEYGFKKNKFLVGLKAGYGDWGTATYGLGLEYALSNYFGIGIDGAYTNWDDNAYTYPEYDTSGNYTYYTLKYSYTLIGLLASMSYHFNPGEKFDPYVKAGFGYFLINSESKWSPKKPTGFSYAPSAEASGVGYGGQAGFNFFFTKAFSVSLSGGWPFYASGGVTVRF